MKTAQESVSVRQYLQNDCNIKLIVSHYCHSFNSDFITKKRNDEKFKNDSLHQRILYKLIKSLSNQIQVLENDDKNDVNIYTLK